MYLYTHIGGSDIAFIIRNLGSSKKGKESSWCKQNTVQGASEKIQAEA